MTEDTQSGFDTTYDGGLELDLSDAVEPEVIGADDETALARPYTLAVIKAEVREGTSEKTGKDYKVFDVLFRVTDADCENPKPVNYSMFLPTGADTKEQTNNTKLRLKKFRTALGYSGGDENKFPMDEESLAGYRGQEAQAMLKLERNELYGDRNFVRYFV